MTKQKGFTRECEDVAVRLAQTSGRTRRELAENLGVGLSTLTRWIARNRDREIDAPENARSEDMTAELKRLRRENEILRQEQFSEARPPVRFLDEKKELMSNSSVPSSLRFLNVGMESR